MSIRTVVKYRVMVIATNLMATFKRYGRWTRRGACHVRALALVLARNFEGTDANGFDRDRRIRRVNPGTGYPIARGSVDIGGYSYGSAHESERYWNQE